jgi:tetratricopeptide (TPR) repeat protein
MRAASPTWTTAATRLLALTQMVEPFRAFRGRTPAAVHALVDALPDILFGRLRRASERLSLAVEVFRTDDLAPISAPERRLSEAAARGLRVLDDVNQFDPRLEEVLAQLDALGFRYDRLVAQATRAVRHRYRGEEGLAKATERAMEPESVALGSWSTDVQNLYFAHPAYARTSDVDGLQRWLEHLERVLAQGFRVEARVACARGDLRRARGESDEACAVLRAALAAVAPRDLLMRRGMGSSLAEAELAAGSPDRVLAASAEVLSVGDREPDAAIVLPRLRASRVRGLALLARGRTEEASATLEPALAVAETLDVPSLAGLLHEARARVALAEEDRVTYLLHCAEAERHLRPTENPILVAILDRLVSAGASADMPDPDRVTASAPDDATVAQGSRSHASR